MSSWVSRAAAVLALLAGPAWAASAPFAASYNITSVETNDATTWRVGGTLRDYTAAGWDELDVPTGCVVVCESGAGALDLYTVTTIATQILGWLELILDYAPAGTPSAGAPTFGEAGLSEGPYPMPRYTAPRGTSGYLADGMAALALREVAADVASSSAPAETDPVWSAVSNAVTVAAMAAASNQTFSTSVTAWTNFTSSTTYRYGFYAPGVVGRWLVAVGQRFSTVNTTTGEACTYLLYLNNSAAQVSGPNTDDRAIRGNPNTRDYVTTGPVVVAVTNVSDVVHVVVSLTGDSDTDAQVGAMVGVYLGP